MSQNNPAGGGSTGDQGAQGGAGGDANAAQSPPPARLANRVEVAITAAFLVGLTAYLLWGISSRWPACELTDDLTAGAAAESNANRNANANANANGNANTNANANRNTNANTNANVNANVNAGGNTSADAGAGAPTQPPAEPNQGRPELTAVEPASGSIDGGKTVTIRGRGLAGDDVIRFDEKEATRVGEGGGETLNVRTPRHDEGRVDVTLYRGRILMARLPAGYTYVCPAPSGRMLFLMLIMAGALGGCIHAMRSLWWYVGNQELRAPWLSMYFLLPFIGAAMAMLFSLLIVAGVVDNTTGRSTSLFIIAIAGLVGMFSQQAALKLTDIANAFFTKPGPGRDAKPQESQSVGERGAGAAAAAPTITPDSGPSSGGTPVIIANTRFADVKSVTFGGESAKDVKFDGATSTITAVTPEHAEGEVEVVVTNQAKASVVLHYTYTPAGGSPPTDTGGGGGGEPGEDVITSPPGPGEDVITSP